MPSGVPTSPRRQAAHQPPPPQAAPVTLTAEQRAKLHSELDVVESNAKVLAEMLSELSPGKEHQDDAQLLQVCYNIFCFIISILKWWTFIRKWLTFIFL